MKPGSVTTVRLPEGLRERADQLAYELGLSLNALLTVALADYVREREPRGSAAPRQAPQIAQGAPIVDLVGGSRQVVRAAARAAKKGR